MRDTGRAERLRLAELLAALSLATDLGNGMPLFAVDVSARRS